MVFVGGHEKIGGRKKGTPNKRTTRERNLIRQIVDKELKAFPRLLERVEPKERMLIVTRLMPFVYARKQEVSIQEETTALLSNLSNLNDEELARLKDILTECIGDDEQ